MTVRDIVLPLPEDLYVRLEQTAHATKQSLTDMLVRSLRAGSPPDWLQAPAEFQADLAALDRLGDDALWRIARSQRSEADAARLQELLENNADDALTAAGRLEMDVQVAEADRFMLRKAHAAALLNGAAMLCRPLKGYDRVAIYLSTALRQRLVEVDDHRCAYCRTSQANSGSPMVVDHLLPLSKGGMAIFENLCFACYRCNLFKGSQVEAIDPLRGEIAPLFHPRRDRWGDHFAWDEAGLRILGSTPVGRATVTALNMNNEVIMDARRNLGSARLASKFRMTSNRTQQKGRLSHDRRPLQRKRE